jgi:hypothetical protein
MEWSSLQQKLESFCLYDRRLVVVVGNTVFIYAHPERDSAGFGKAEAEGSWSLPNAV